MIRKIGTSRYLLKELDSTVILECIGKEWYATVSNPKRQAITNLHLSSKGFKDAVEKIIDGFLIPYAA